MTVQFHGSGGDAAAVAPRSPFDRTWMMRRALIGMLILALGVGSLAWLTHASIDPALEPAAAPGEMTR